MSRPSTRLRDWGKTWKPRHDDGGCSTQLSPPRDGERSEAIQTAAAERFWPLGLARLGCDSRHDHLDPRPCAGFAFELDAPAQPVEDDIVDDVQAKPNAAFVAPRGEERIEGLPAQVRAHAAAIVGNGNLDIALAGRANLDSDPAALAIGKRVRDRVQEQVGQHLPA